MNHFKRPPALALAAFAAVPAATVDMYLPALPSIAKDLGTSQATVQWTLAAFMISFGLSQLYLGYLSDRLGRVRVVRMGMALYVVGSIACFLSPSIGWLIFSRIIQGAGACSGHVYMSSVSRDIFQGHERHSKMAMIMGTVALAPILAPILGSFVMEYFSWRPIFLVLLIFALGLSLLSLFLPETLDPNRIRSTLLEDYRAIVRDRTFVAFSGVNVFTFAMLLSYVSLSPHVLISVFGVSEKNFGYFFALNASALLLSGYLAPLINKKSSPGFVANFGALILLPASTCLCVLSFVDFGFSKLWPAVSLMTLCTFGGGFLMPYGLSRSLENMGSQAASASAVQGFLRFLLSGLVIGLVSLFTPITLAHLGASVFACASLGLLALYRARSIP